MTNKELKAFIKKNKVHQYEVAEHLGITESRLSVLFRKPLDAEVQAAFLDAAEAIVKERGTAVQPVHAAAVLPHKDLNGFNKSYLACTVDDDDIVF